MNVIGHVHARDPELAADFAMVEPHRGTRLKRRLLRGIPAIIAAMFGGLLVSGALIRIIPPSYSSSVSILIDPKRPGAYGADAEFANIFVDASKIASVEVILLSSGLLERVVRTLHLADQPAFGAWQKSLLERTLPFLFGGTPTEGLDTVAAREARAVERLRRLVRPARVGVTYVIKVDVTASDPSSAQSIAAAIGDAYLADQLETKFDATKRDSLWLGQRLTEQRTQLIRSEVEVEAIRKKFGVMASDTGPDSSIDRQSIAKVNDELLKADSALAEERARYQQYQRVVESRGNLEGLPEIGSSVVIQGLRKEQADVSRHVADLSTRYASGYPELRQAVNQRTAIEQQVGREVARITAGLKDDYEASLAKRDALSAGLATLVAKVNAATSAEGRVELREAERVAEANRVEYEASLTRLREVEQQQTRQDVEARVISLAAKSERPSFPRAAVFLPSGAGLGLLIGAGLVLLRPIGRARVEDADDAERDLLLPVLAMAPYLNRHLVNVANGRQTIPGYLTANPFSAFAESLRILRLRLRAVKLDGCQIVQVTSAVPAEGKSTIAASLAMSAAAAGTRTVLVDLDFHHPAISKLLPHGGAHGVTDILGGLIQSDDAAYYLHDIPLSIISTGSIGAFHHGLIESAALRDFIEGLRSKYDLVVIDTPPVLAVSDPLFISALVDQTIMVVAWRSTSQRLVDQALSALRATDAPLVGIVLNKVQAIRNTEYGKYYYRDTATAVI